MHQPNDRNSCRNRQAVFSDVRPLRQKIFRSKTIYFSETNVQVTFWIDVTTPISGSVAMTTLLSLLGLLSNLLRVSWFGGGVEGLLLIEASAERTCLDWPTLAVVMGEDPGGALSALWRRQRNEPGWLVGEHRQIWGDAGLRIERPVGTTFSEAVKDLFKIFLFFLGELRGRLVEFLGLRTDWRRFEAFIFQSKS